MFIRRRAQPGDGFVQTGLGFIQLAAGKGHMRADGFRFAPGRVIAAEYCISCFQEFGRQGRGLIVVAEGSIIVRE